MSFAARLLLLPRLWKLLRKELSLSSKTLLLLLLAYVVWPFDLLPDVAVVLGWIDDALLIVGVLTWVWNRLPDDAKKRLRKAAQSGRTPPERE